MIAVQELNDRILSRLDAENSERYLFDQDIKPAVNGAIEMVVTALTQAFAENKLAPEKLSELNKTKVWQANSYSRVAFNAQDVGHTMWTLLAIYPKPVINKTSAFIPNIQKNSASKFRPDVTFIRSIKSAKRLTSEEWNENQDNAFMAGNTILSGSLAEYAYLDASDYSSSTYTSSVDKAEYTIRPDVSNQFVAMNYLKYPTSVSLISDSVEFPKSLTEAIVTMALKYIAYKQGQAPLYSITAQDINGIVSMIK